MSLESNKSLCLRHYREVLTEKHLSVVDQIYADHVRIGDGGAMSRDQLKGYAQMSITAFPDLVVTVHDQIAEGDRVATRWSAEGTHRGDFMGHAGTGRHVMIKAIHIHQIVDGRIATLWEEIDIGSVLKQIGTERV
jgi:steroid delta-isomerase-like uncharacterized protein